jgi:hypothetical protein
MDTVLSAVTGMVGYAIGAVAFVYFVGLFLIWRDDRKNRIEARRGRQQDIFGTHGRMRS